eukprot:4449482-Pyramimonas_sp.AAC.1
MFAATPPFFLDKRVYCRRWGATHLGASTGKVRNVAPTSACSTAVVNASSSRYQTPLAPATLGTGCSNSMLHATRWPHFPQ